jgi:sugar phosphate isomerase/epimerase
MSGKSIEIFHMNDYPDKPERVTMTDAHRVYPGDGVGPVIEVLRGLHAKGKPVVLSLELFNRDYWKQDALTVAKTGLAKMKEQVAKAIHV